MFQLDNSRLISYIKSNLIKKLPHFTTFYHIVNKIKDSAIFMIKKIENNFLNN
tara:strand:+ start:344 stop:502 length:159 start_codon:yes stop_codon:yes gene_type:complete